MEEYRPGRVAELLGSFHSSLVLVYIPWRVLPAMTGVWTLASCQWLELPECVSFPSYGNIETHSELNMEVTFKKNMKCCFEMQNLTDWKYGIKHSKLNKTKRSTKVLFKLKSKIQIQRKKVVSF